MLPRCSHVAKPTWKPTDTVRGGADQATPLIFGKGFTRLLFEPKLSLHFLEALQITNLFLVIPACIKS